MCAHEKLAVGRAGHGRPRAGSWAGLLLVWMTGPGRSPKDEADQRACQPECQCPGFGPGKTAQNRPRRTRDWGRTSSADTSSPSVPRRPTPSAPAPLLGAWGRRLKGSLHRFPETQSVGDHGDTSSQGVAGPHLSCWIHGLPVLASSAPADAPGVGRPMALVHTRP